MQFVLGLVTQANVVWLLKQHSEEMYAISPAESVHTLDLQSLSQPDIRFWTLWDGDHLAGCGAIKRLDKYHAEIKSMRTTHAYRQRGLGSLMLHHLIADAAQLGITRLSLETGSMNFFTPARSLYQKFGFHHCQPFAQYRPDPNSIFMTRTL
ncbi:GNAT family N-acetyltransferase [Shewanella sp. Isolate11]|uniref:GNAT family N-acetyltransferase n=1 Tax=Shewanella sp. Isolate11 TaxID=2908530 RepID=UPI001EFDC790|nr:GNAT family N-acetyltransferase [Shewanella sp. Isolate11]MCG9697844.1 GNAT family N-acetyltransferase [Shewanella sp. Isolate11]